jgi:hypothetical protein
LRREEWSAEEWGEDGRAKAKSKSKSRRETRVDGMEGHRDAILLRGGGMEVSGES